MPRRKKSEINLENTSDKKEVFETLTDATFTESELVKVSKKTKKLSFLNILVLMLFVSFLVTSYLFFQARKLTTDPNIVQEKKIKKTVEMVEKLIDLPQGELPTMAVISSVEGLKDQPFFMDAKEGDVVLLFNNAQKIYLFDPEKNIILNASSLNFGVPQSQ